MLCHGLLRRHKLGMYSPERVFVCVCVRVCVWGGRGGIRDDELERIWKEAVLIYSRLYPHVFLVGMYEL